MFRQWLRKLLKGLPRADGLVMFTAGRAAYVCISVDPVYHRFDRHVSADYTNKKVNMGEDRAGRPERPTLRGKMGGRANTTP